MQKSAYASYTDVYDIAMGMQGDAILLRPNVALTSAILGVVHNADPERQDELMGTAATRFYRASVAQTNNPRVSAIRTRERYFLATEKFVEAHYWKNPTAGIATIIVEELRKLAGPNPYHRQPVLTGLLHA